MNQSLDLFGPFMFCVTSSSVFFCATSIKAPIKLIITEISLEPGNVSFDKESDNGKMSAETR